MPLGVQTRPRRTWIGFLALLAITALIAIAPLRAAQEAGGNSVDADLLRRAGIAAQQFADRMGVVRYTEHLAQRELRENGKVNYQHDAYFDSLTLLRRDNGRFVVDETAEKERASKNFEVRPLLNTSGFSTMALVLHPFYEKSFHFSAVEDEVVSGQRLQKVRFEHIKGSDSPTALRMREKDYPLDFSGFLWLDPATASVVRILASLSEPMDDLGVLSLSLDVQYGSVMFPETSESFWLPQSATIELQTPKQHWRNIHTYSKYRKYSVDVVIGEGETK
jgi:hypothetical protein